MNTLTKPKQPTEAEIVKCLMALIAYDKSVEPKHNTIYLYLISPRKL